MANNIVATWGFKRKLPEPFEDYTDHAIFDDIASKYCTQPRKKSTLHAATLRAVLAYLELENPVGSTPPEKLGAVGTQSNPIWTPLRKQQPFSATTFTGEPAMHQVSRPVVLRLTFRQTAYCR